MQSEPINNNIKEMTYGEFRSQFASVEEFRKAFAAIPYEEARKMISKEQTSTMIKAAMITTWEQCRREYMEPTDNN